MNPRKLLISAATVAVSAAAVTAASGIASGAKRSPATHKQPAASAAEFNASFGIFRRPRRTSDALPSTFANSVSGPDADPGLASLDLASSRRALTTPDLQLFVVKRGADGVCMFAKHRAGGVNLTCAPLSSASNPATPLLAIGDSVTYGLIPDRVRGVRAAKDGGEPAKLTQGENVVATEASGPGSSLTLSDETGSTSEVSTALPPQPRVP